MREDTFFTVYLEKMRLDISVAYVVHLFLILLNFLPNKILVNNSLLK